MGEVIKKLSSGKVRNTEVNIELNEPSYEGSEYKIHIQSSIGRVEVDIKEFRAIASAIISGLDKLKSYKKNV